MTIYWSAARGGFFDSALHADLPADAVEIDQQMHAALLEQQSAGHVLTSVGGLPVAHPPAFDNLAFLSAFRRARNAALAASDWTQGADAPLAANAIEAWATYRKALRDAPSLVEQQLADGFEPSTIALPVRPA